MRLADSRGRLVAVVASLRSMLRRSKPQAADQRERGSEALGSRVHRLTADAVKTSERQRLRFSYTVASGLPTVRSRRILSVLRIGTVVAA